MDGQNIFGFVFAAILVIIAIFVVGIIANIGQGLTSSSDVTTQALYTKDLNIGETSIDVSDGNRFIAQTFVAKLNRITTIDVNLGKFSTGTKDLNVTLWNTTGGKPSTALLTTIVLASSKTVGKPTLTTLTFNTPVTAGSTYAIGFDYNDSYVAGGVDLNYWITSAKTANPITDGALYASLEGTTWYPIDGNNTDLTFAVNFDQVTGWDAGTIALVGLIGLALGAGLVIYIVKNFMGS